MGRTELEGMGPVVREEGLTGYGSKEARRRGPMVEVEVMIGGAKRQTGPR
jgi:hypothetical protein